MLNFSEPVSWHRDQVVQVLKIRERLLDSVRQAFEPVLLGDKGIAPAVPRFPITEPDPLHPSLPKRLIRREAVHLKIALGDTVLANTVCQTHAQHPTKVMDPSSVKICRRLYAFRG